MKLEVKDNANYAATVVSVGVVLPLEGRDKIVGAPFFGFQAIVSASIEVGEVGILFPAECQLSEDYCKENNLYRHEGLNKDVGAKGYLEDNRRVRAIKFGGHRSDCLFMPLESLSYLGKDVVDGLSVGDTFDSVNGIEICKKYIVRGKKPREGAGVKKNKYKEPRVDEKVFPRHYDSDNYWRNSHVISAGTEIVVTQKLHGTSVRIGNVEVKKKRTLLDKLLRKPVALEYDYVFGSRKVIKDPGNEASGFYDEDIWSIVGESLRGLLPKGVLVYGEIVGFTSGGGQLQGDYAYECKKGEWDFYVYRVAMVNPDGFIVDLVWDQVVEFCRDLGIKTVVELWRGKHEDFVVDDWIDKRFVDEGYREAVGLSSVDTVDEGVCVRVDGLAPYILKAKSPIFLGWETEQLDKDIVDIESDA